MSYILRRALSTTSTSLINQNLQKSILQPTSSRFKSFAQYRLSATQRDPLFNQIKTRMLLNKKPIVQIEVKDDYYSFDNKFKKIARSIEYKE